MPELIEVKIMSEFINQAADNHLFKSIHISELTKNKLSQRLQSLTNFKIQSFSRGKELKICFNNDFNLFFAMGMSGNFILSENVIKHTHLWFERDDNLKLCLVDVRRFAKWKETETWNKNRSPCPFQEQEEFTNNLKFYILNKPTIFKNKNIGEILLEQKLFNGIGNYLRAEIIARMDIEPWRDSLEVLKNKVLFDKLIELCYTVPALVYMIGGGQIKDWKNPNLKIEIIDNKQNFFEWIIVYGKQSSYIDSTGRKMWFQNKFKKC